jgi:dTDP-4-amino-4,6-dideoxygalactose transaminase
MGYAEGSFPVTERAAAEIVSLPMYPQLTAAQQARVAAEVRAFMKTRDVLAVAQAAGRV